MAPIRRMLPLPVEQQRRGDKSSDGEQTDRESTPTDAVVAADLFQGRQILGELREIVAEFVEEMVLDKALHGAGIEGSLLGVFL